ncbi:family 20 glycosylhydrolase [Halomontanus rarus]|uniref:family 20 glycosylhydrolase n=1 Tax=Halomontanus rarus TaxID=3034020 RepID=UPI0021040EF1
MTSTGLHVVPRPRRVDTGSGAVRFDAPIVIGMTEADAPAVVSLFETHLERETNERIVRGDDDGDSDVRLVLEDRPAEEFDGREGYVLEADGDADTVTIRAETADGLRYGCQTFVTGLAFRTWNGRDGDGIGDGDRDRWAFPDCTIHDWSETSWRGFLLDPAWGFLSIDRVKRRIDQAARAKLNRLRLRLLDDEGYALESEAFPELTRGSDGSTRPAYSPDDVAELVDYAARRGIEIVPRNQRPLPRRTRPRDVSGAPVYRRER